MKGEIEKCASVKRRKKCPQKGIQDFKICVRRSVRKDTKDHFSEKGKM
jgi:hypothetical protein